MRTCAERRGEGSGTPFDARAHLVHFKSKDARYVLSRAALRTQLPVSLQKEVRESGAEEGAINVVAAGHVVVVELAAAWAEELHRVVATQRHRIRQTHRQHRLLLAEGPRARPKFTRLELSFLRTRERGARADGERPSPAIGGGGAPSRGWRADWSEQAGGAGKKRLGEKWPNACDRGTAHHVAESLGGEYVARVDQAVEHTRRLKHLVDALRRVGQLFLCARRGRENRRG